MKQIVEEEWGKDRKIEVVPLPFTPSDSLLNIPIVEANYGRPVICFVGKLEARKGLLILMEAIPAIIKQLPNALFRFIGEPLPSPVNGLDMKDYLLKQLPSYANHLEFKGRQPAERIPALLDDVQVCIFPSLWENFPNVCLEAMAAGKVVIGTSNGGMADMINSGRNGFLVPPKSPSAISNVVVELFTGKYDLNKIGSAARERILSEYNRERIGQLTEDFYERTIQSKLNRTRLAAGQIGIL
jgi:glycosyltransferase involved in cell wall biosynthesis